MNKFLAFLAGASTGALAALLLAPKSGKELRGSISSTVHDGVDMVTQKVDEGRRAFEEQGGIRGIVDKGVEKMGNVASIGRRKVGDVIETGKDRLNDAIEAGKEEYRREISSM